MPASAITEAMAKPLLWLLSSASSNWIIASPVRNPIKACNGNRPPSCAILSTGPAAKIAAAKSSADTATSGTETCSVVVVHGEQHDRR